MNKDRFTKLITAIITLIITVILVIFLLSQINMGDVGALLIKIKPMYFFAGFVMIAFGYLVRSLRFYILLNREVGLKNLFSIVCIHNMAISIFPMRSGELSYIYFLTKRHNRTVGEGAATLIVARLLDIITISLLFFISTILISNNPDTLYRTLQVIGFLLFGLVLILILLMYYGNRFISILRIISLYLRIGKINIVNYVFRQMDEIVKSLNCISRNQFIWSVFLSFLIWIILYIVNYIMVIAMGIDISFYKYFLAITIFFMTPIIPVQGIGGFGTLEGGWTIGFMAVGIPKEIAISTGFLAHIIGIFYSLILFLIGINLLHEKTNTR